MSRSRILIAIACLAVLAVAGLALSTPAVADNNPGGDAPSCQSYGGKLEEYSYSGCKSNVLVVAFEYQCCGDWCTWRQVNSWCK